MSLEKRKRGSFMQESQILLGKIENKPYVG